MRSLRNPRKTVMLGRSVNRRRQGHKQRSNSTNRNEPMTLSSRSLYRRGMMEKLEDRNLLTSVPWNEVTELLVPRGLTGAGEAGEIRNVAMDGDYVVVGVRNNDQVATDAGSAYVFRRDNNVTPTDLGDDKWPLVATLFGTTTSPQGSDLKIGDFFGESVAIDGEWMMIGADHPTELAGGTALGDGLGVVYVYHFENGTWQYKQKLAPSERGGINDKFGLFNSLALEGNLAAVGAPWDDNATGVDQGAVYIYRLNGAQWEEIAKIVPTEDVRPASNVKGSGLGQCIKLEGGELMVSALFADGNSTDTGAIYVFTEDVVSGKWLQSAKLSASDGQAVDRFGHHLARQENIIVVGAFGADAAGTDSGAAYVFEKSASGGWEETAKLLSNNLAASDQFGHEVGIKDGKILVGGMRSDGIKPNTGAVFSFENVGGQWTEVEELFESDRTPAPAADDPFGRTLTLATLVRQLSAVDTRDQITMLAMSTSGPKTPRE